MQLSLMMMMYQYRGYVVDSFPSLDTGFEMLELVNFAIVVAVDLAAGVVFARYASEMVDLDDVMR